MRPKVCEPVRLRLADLRPPVAVTDQAFRFDVVLLHVIVDRGLCVLERREASQFLSLDGDLRFAGQVVHLGGFPAELPIVVDVGAGREHGLGAVRRGVGHHSCVGVGAFAAS